MRPTEPTQSGWFESGEQLLLENNKTDTTQYITSEHIKETEPEGGGFETKNYGCIGPDRLRSRVKMQRRNFQTPITGIHASLVSARCERCGRGESEDTLDHHQRLHCKRRDQNPSSSLIDN